MQCLTKGIVAASGVLALIAAGLAAGCDHQQETSAMTHAAKQGDGPAARATATFGAGCFWGVEATFRKVPGVLDAAVGYSGGTTDNPTYKDVCTDRTGHAEVVQVSYDPNRVSYEKLLEVFWSCHDPTTLNRQGPDIGTQYRSVVFYHTPEQQAAAESAKARLEQAGKGRGRIVTQIAPAATFWRAEEYHQRYLEKHGQAACPSH